MNAINRSQGDDVEGMRTLLRGSLGKSLQAMGEQDRLAAAWTVVCGPVLCRRSSVVGYADGVIEVQVVDKLWLNQLRAMRSQLVQSLSAVANVPIDNVRFELETRPTGEEGTR